MNQLIFPPNYKSILDIKQTEIAIKAIKDFFQLNLSSELRLRRITAPLFVERGTGINDDLNGIEKPVSFQIPAMNNITAEIVHSLAKWKRIMLADLEIEKGYGIYTDMNAIRADEELDNIHSLYVDQWDWEKTISSEERKVKYLKSIVTKIYEVVKKTEFFIFQHYPQIKPILPENITFVHAEELVREYKDLPPKQREYMICKKYGAVFIIGIGNKLSDGKAHDGRAPDYDDWSTLNEDGFSGFNGDILLWNPILKMGYEISSMGIRVNKETLLQQLKLSNQQERTSLVFHQRLLNGELPDSIGGGIGQSRICMFFLRKAHIGEIQVSLWPEEMKKQCQDHGINLL